MPKKTPSSKSVFFAVQEDAEPAGPFDTIEEAKEEAGEIFDYTFRPVYITKVVLQSSTPKVTVLWEPI